MGLVADMAGALLTKVEGAQDQHNLLSSVLGLLNHPEIGGLQGLLEKFKASGLGSIANQWVAQGPNPPISPAQLQQVFSADQIRAFAQKLGMNPDQATQHLAEILPSVVDHLTPNGTVPQGAPDASAVLAALKAKLFGA